MRLLTAPAAIALNRTTEDWYIYSLIVRHIPARPERTLSLLKGKSKGRDLRTAHASTSPCGRSLSWACEGLSMVSGHPPAFFPRLVQDSTSPRFAFIPLRQYRRSLTAYISTTKRGLPRRSEMIRYVTLFLTR